MIGHITPTKANITDSCGDRLNKAKIARGLIKQSFITDLKINTKLRLSYQKALITKMIQYSIRKRPLNETSLRKIQPFRPICIQYIINVRYTSG